MVKKLVLVASGISAAFLSAPAAHANITGRVDATITLTAGCIINGTNYDDGANNVVFGNLNFGGHNTLFTQADAQVLSGATGFTVQCSNGIAPTIAFQSGLNDSAGGGTGLHAMAHQTTPGQFVSYNLYSDTARTTVIPVGGSIALAPNGALQTVNVYGRAFGRAGLTTGTYTDVLTVVVTL